MTILIVTVFPAEPPKVHVAYNFLAVGVIVYLAKPVLLIWANAVFVKPYPPISSRSLIVMSIVGSVPATADVITYSVVFEYFDMSNGYSKLFPFAATVIVGTSVTISI